VRSLSIQRLGRALLSWTPTVAALALLGFLGMLASDWGRVLRRQANKMLRERLSEFRSSDASFGLRLPNRQIIAEVTLAESDILRWLSMNESDPLLTGQDVIQRNLAYPAMELEDAVLSLVSRRFVTLVGGRLVFSEGGRSYGIDAGWTSRHAE
jgi:hypothetical protein